MFFLPLCRGAVGVFYSHSRLGNTCNGDCFFLFKTREVYFIGVHVEVNAFCRLLKAKPWGVSTWCNG